MPTEGPRDESDLDRAMGRYADGDARAFEVVYDGLAGRLHAFLRRRARDDERAADLLQQTFLHMHRARGTFARGARVVPWAFAIARRLAIDVHRRAPRERVANSTDELERFDALVGREPRADELTHAREIVERALAVLERLPEAQRTAFLLVREEQLSIAEAAEALGATEAAVKLRAHRAYVALREALGDVLASDGGGAT